MKTSNFRVKRLWLGTSITAVILAAPTVHAQAVWLTAGHDLNNTRSQPAEKTIGTENVQKLALKWQVVTRGDVTANPAIDGDYAYFPDAAGFLYKVNRWTGAVVWKYRIAKYTGIVKDYARATPAVAGKALILGNNSGRFQQSNSAMGGSQPAQVFAVDKETGARLWSTQVDATKFSFITNSAIAYNNTAYVGTASDEEFLAYAVPKAHGWTFHFRGSVVALDVVTGSIKWRTYTVPFGYTGGSVWGSTAALDPANGRLYFATGNNYSVPDSVLACLKGGGSPASCLDPQDHFDSIMALDINNNGAVIWAARGLEYDAWNGGCGRNAPGFDNCPDPKGPDWEFAQGPILMVSGNGSHPTLIGAGQKSGKFWAFNAKTGALAWVTQVAPGGAAGGLQWGSAFDGNRIYVAVSNSGPTGDGSIPGVWTLNNGSTTTAGGWAALDPSTGKVVWTTPDPHGSRAEAAVSVANGVVYGCNLDPAHGTMYALKASNGTPLWFHNSGPGTATYPSAECAAGPSIAGGMVYWGTGTRKSTGPHKVFGFGLR